MREWITRQTQWGSLHGRIARATREEDADDLLQSALLRVLETQGRPIACPEAYVLRTAINLRTDRVRRARRYPIVALDDTLADHAPLPDEAVQARDRLLQLAARLGTLPERTRAIVLAHRIDGSGYEEIARQHGISVSAVEKHVCRAMQILSAGDQEGERADPR